MLTQEAVKLKRKLKEAKSIAHFAGKERDDILKMLRGSEDLEHVDVPTLRGETLDITTVLAKKYQSATPEITKELDAALRKIGIL